MAATDWEDISVLLPVEARDLWGVTTIEVDPSDPQRVWIGCGGYVIDWSPEPGFEPPYNGQYRVYYSEDGGDTWTEQSAGLPGFAINDLIYQRGSNDALYAATDVGVFYRNASMDRWECLNNGLPSNIVTDLEIDYCKERIYASSFGRGLWSLPLQPCMEVERVIDTDLTIAGTQYLASNLRVTDGHILTITGELYCYKDVRLIVEPHARVVIDGGLVTTQCPGQRYKGFEISGNSTQTQSGYPLATHQGRLDIINGGIIENAEIGALACGRTASGALDLSKTGGIIVANEASFKNCGVGVFLPPWPDPNGGLSINTANQSRFTRTTFEVNSAYPTEGAPFTTHALLWRIFGPNFAGCQFKNTRADSEVSGSADLGQGIYSLDARFKVVADCPCGQWLEPAHTCICAERSRFEGLDHAIEAGDALTTRNFTVVNTDFVNNICGVYANGVVNPVVKNNHFTMGGRGVLLTHPSEIEWQDLHRAVYTTETYGTRIDDNVIVMDANAQSLAEGVVTGDVRDHNDVVFRNRVTGLVNGYVGEGINADPDNKTNVGLWWLCNLNDDNGQDLYCRYPANLDEDDEPDATVRTIQGAPNRPADNTFDNVHPEGDFKSDNTHNNIVYWYRADGQAAYQPVEVTPSYVAPQGTTDIPADNCARRVIYTHVIGDGGTGTITSAIAVIDDEKLAYGNTRYLYDQLIDGGSTDEVVAQITSSWPQDAWDLRGYLLSRSPYLSVEVLQRAVIRNVMPPAMLTEVLVANPEATQRDGFFRWLQEESGHPLPAYLLELVVASWDNKTYRSTLEAEMAGHHATMTMAADLLLAAYQEDTITDPVDSLRWVWRKVRTKAARYAEALLFVQTGDFNSASAIVSTIPAEHDLKDPEEQERLRMLDLIAFLEGVYADGRDETALTGPELDALETIIDGKYDRPAAWAQNLLCFGYQRCRPPRTGGGTGGLRRSDAPRATIPVDEERRLWAQPNPATLYTELCFALLNEEVATHLIVRDIAGRETRRFLVQGSQGRALWDTRAVEAGTYTVELFSGDRKVLGIRLVVKP